MNILVRKSFVTMKLYVICEVSISCTNYKNNNHKLIYKSFHFMHVLMLFYFDDFSYRVDLS